MSRFHFVRFGALVAFLGAMTALLSGCGRPVGTVSGKVTYQGKPLKAGNVAFVSTEGRQSFAAGIKEDGTYSVPNITGGTYKVCVDTSSFKPPGGGGVGAPGGVIAPGASSPIVPKGAKTGPPPGAAIPEGYQPSDPNAMLAGHKKYVPIPEKYAREDTTDLSYEFKGGTVTFDIDLK